MKSIEIYTQTNNSKGELVIKNVDQLDWSQEIKLYALGLPCVNLTKSVDVSVNQEKNSIHITFDINNDANRDVFNHFMKKILKRQEVLVDQSKEVEHNLNDLFIARRNCNVFKEFTNFTEAICDTKKYLESLNEEIKSLKNLYNFFSTPWTYLIANHNIDEPRIIQVILHR